MTTLPDILAIEHATLNAVPALRHMFDGPFVVRRFLGGTGRANAACGLDPRPDPDLPVRVARIERFYAGMGQVCRFRSTPLDPAGLGDVLAARGYRRQDESQVIGGRLVDFAQADLAVEILAGPEERWTAVMGTAEHQAPARRSEKARMPELLAVPAAWVLLHEDGVPAACCFATADGPHAGLFDLAVRPEFRRRGLGQRVMAAAGAWAMQQGASWAYAQVACTNIASLTMNARLGLREHYRYVYLLKDVA